MGPLVFLTNVQHTELSCDSQCEAATGKQGIEAVRAPFYSLCGFSDDMIYTLTAPARMHWHQCSYPRDLSDFHLTLVHPFFVRPLFPLPLSRLCFNSG